MKKVGFIGCGKMASALALGGVRAGVLRGDDLLFSDVHAPSAELLASASGGCVVGTGALVAEADVVVVAVKPADVEGVLRANASGLEGKLVVSIAAGLGLGRLEAWSGVGARVVRVMPNTPVMVGVGAAAYSLGSAATDGDGEWVRGLFSATGLCVRVAEKLMDAVTGLSGSGPAYGYVLIEALADGGVLMGLPRDTALKLAAQTLMGAARMVLEGGSPGPLKDAVASPGGTTIAGLEVLEVSAVRGALMRAVRAAAERSVEMGG
jgi:pyrroline-5-carboxylate reductase